MLLMERVVSVSISFFVLFDQEDQFLASISLSLGHLEAQEAQEDLEVLEDLEVMVLTPKRAEEEVIQ